jgi:hypothetical protein
MSQTKSVSIGDFLTEAQIHECTRLYGLKGRFGSGWLHGAIRDDVIAPNMVEIDRKLGQENNADYLAYAVEHVLNQAGCR